MAISDKYRPMNYCFKKYFIVFILFHFSVISSNACTCRDLNCFLHEISGKELIIRVRILEHDTFPADVYLKERMKLYFLEHPEYIKDSLFIPPVPPTYRGYTKLLVEEVILGNLHTDTIGFLNGSGGGACLASMERFRIGSSCILKLYGPSTNLMEYNELTKLKPFIRKYPVFEVFMCFKWFLSYENDCVIGYILNNKKFDLRRKLFSEPALTSEERDKLMEQILEFQPESFSMDEFKQLLGQKLKTLGTG